MEPSDSIFREDPEDGSGRFHRKVSIDLFYVHSDIVRRRKLCSLQVLKCPEKYVGLKTMTWEM
jgi:hypothetical protein